MARAPALVTRNTLARQIYEVLLSRIRSGSLRPGERLVEAEIAASVGTSRGPVREAIAMLQRTGLATSDPFVGASITALGRDEIVEIYSLRSVLEGYAASRAVQRGTPAELAQLRAITGRMRETKGSQVVSRLRELDAQFHATLVQLAHEEHLWHAWERLRARIALYHSTVEAAFSDGERLARMHDELIEALRPDDPVGTEQRVRAHLMANGEEWTMKGNWPQVASKSRGEG